jgi:2-oxoglutarate dehydrogenase E2 component (dihydrolipoamide succinyltransferase)
LKLFLESKKEPEVKTPIKVPAVGESITEGTIASWAKKNGDYVKRDEVILVLETDKASVDVVAESEGTLTTKAKAGDVVKIGAVVGEIDSDGKPSAAAAPTPKTEPPAAKPANGNGSSKPTGSAAAPSTPPPSSSFKTETMAPSVRRLVSEGGINPENVQATGRGGRLTKADVLGAGATASPAPVTQAPKGTPAPVSFLKSPVSQGQMGQEIVREPMTTIRKRIAERLVQAQSTAAILTTFNEIDMSNCMAVRKKYKEPFEKKYGIGLGFMGFFVKAVNEALKAYPRVNAFIEGNDIVYHNYYNIGVAVGTEKGLMVPVLRGTEHMSLAEIELTIKGFAQKARDGKISVDDLSGGTFTISNGGVYGSLMSTPILNPPQSGILGMHKIEERPIALNGEVVIRPMMYVALSYDHRIVDGGESVSFLVRVKECIEDPTRLLLEI